MSSLNIVKNCEYSVSSKTIRCIKKTKKNKKFVARYRQLPILLYILHSLGQIPILDSHLRL